MPVSIFTYAADSLGHADLRHDGVRSDRRVPGRAVPDPHPLYVVSLPYHIGNGWFGGMLPLLATAMVAAKGDIYYGLWYPIIVALITAVVGFLFLYETKNVDLHADVVPGSAAARRGA